MPDHQLTHLGLSGNLAGLFGSGMVRFIGALLQIMQKNIILFMKYQIQTVVSRYM
jgi:hypothetical protein